MRTQSHKMNTVRPKKKEKLADFHSAKVLLDLLEIPPFRTEDGVGKQRGGLPRGCELGTSFEVVFVMRHSVCNETYGVMRNRF
jgi:hypothetical protein